MDKSFKQKIAISLQAEKVPAASIALINNGEISAHVFGIANSKTKQAIDTDTVFECASITKPMFAYIVLKLAQENIIDIDKPLNDYLPEPYIANEPCLNTITTRHVLSHSTGFPNWRGDNPLRVHFTTGERWSYSGEGFVYLQKVIEHLTKRTLNDLADEYLLEPLALSRTHMIWVADDFSDNAAYPHNENGNLVNETHNVEANAAASAYSTPSGIARFMMHLFDNSPISNLMLSSQIAVNTLVPWHEDWPDGEYDTLDDVSWGLGWGLQQNDGKNYFWHWGDNGTFQCFAIASPVEKSGVVVMTNGQNGRHVYMPIVEHILGGKQPALNWLRGAYG